MAPSRVKRLISCAYVSLSLFVRLGGGVAVIGNSARSHGGWCAVQGSVFKGRFKRPPKFEEYVMYCEQFNILELSEKIT